MSLREVADIIMAYLMKIVGTGFCLMGIIWTVYGMIQLWKWDGK